MAHYEARMSSKGQLTVPAKVREALELKEGDVVDFYLREGTRRVEFVARNRPISELFGMLKDLVDPTLLPLTQEDIDDAIATHVAEDDRRIQRQWQERQEFEAWRRARRGDAAE